MRLKSIKLAGFKSFVDPTAITFKSNLTAIVGPNGCGKSNVIDAVRWVMGESSAKYLRGESMADVIFNGSSQRKPVSQASIELFFDNSSGKMGGAYADYAEIAVKRLVTRDGQSTYFLNGSRCRRRDITDLFLGTGLGARSYAIIEQGMISRLIEARPEELRTYLEEAAGISKYKERRRETENRIRRTQDNLERLADLREELGKQLARLGRQAEAAKYYKKLKQEERLYKAELAVLRWRQADNQLASLLENLANLELEQEACLVKLRQGEAQLETSRERQAQASDAYDVAQQHLTQISMQIARLEQGLEHQLKREKQLQQQLAQLETQAAASQEAFNADQEQLEILQAQLEHGQPELEQLEAIYQERQTSLASLEEQLQSVESSWASLLNQANSSQQKKAVLQAQIQQQQSNLVKNQQRQENLQARLQENQQPQQTQQLADLNAQLEILEAQLENLSQQQEEERGQRLELQERQQAQRQLGNNLASQQQQAQGRLASLQALQQAELAGQDAELERWLEQENLHLLPRLGQLIQVEAGWEAALETALAQRLNALVVPAASSSTKANLPEKRARLHAKLSQLPSGQLQAFFAPESTSAPVSKQPSLLSKVLNSQHLPASLAASLSQIYLATSLEEALALAPQLAANSSYITAQGDQVFADGMQVQAPTKQNLGLLARQQAIQHLEEHLEQLEAQLEDLQQQEDDLQQQLAELEQSLIDTQAQDRAVTAQIAELSRQEASLKAQVEHQQQAHFSLQEELAELELELAQIEENLTRAQEDLAELDLTAASEAASSQQQQQAREDLRRAYEQERHASSQAQTNWQEAKLQQQLIATKLEAAQQASQRLEQQLSAITQQQQKLLAEQAAHKLEQVENTELELLLEEHQQQEQKVTELRQEQHLAQEEQQSLASQRTQLDKQLNALRQQLEEQRLQQQKFMLQRDSHLAQLQELETNLHQVLQTLSPDAIESTWQNNLHSTQEKIRRLGAINLAAIDEYDQQAERKTYLDAQNAELEDALNTLNKAINRIDRETRERFKATFEQVNQGIQELFPKIFGGGSAWLELTGDNLLETGVAIMARPPGKKNATIHLLSGGEKALTALALVFAIFQLNPAPFCMLDEVDAPLDDANVGRYARLVKEMSSRIQFIYITHNKQAMESAEQLMGVTMQEPGVSRLVSVDLAEASAMVAS